MVRGAEMCHHQHGQFPVFDLAENPVITGPIAPQPGQIGFEPFTKPTRIGGTRLRCI